VSKRKAGQLRAYFKAQGFGVGKYIYPPDPDDVLPGDYKFVVYADPTGKDVTTALGEVHVTRDGVHLEPSIGETFDPTLVRVLRAIR